MGCILDMLTKPLTTHNFTLSITGVDPNLLLLVTSTEFPSDSLQDMVLHISGEPVRYPAKASNSGTWSFSIPEYSSSAVRNTIESLRSKIYNQKSGNLQMQSLSDVTISINDLDRSYLDSGHPIVKTILHGAYLTSHNSVNLNSTQPAEQLSWQYTFHYQWLEDIYEN